MEIKKLLAMPEMIRNSEDTGFEYPAKFQNKMFQFEGSYIHIEDNKYAAIPAELIDSIIIAKIKDQATEPLPLDIMGSKVAVTDINKLIEKRLVDAFTPINRVIDNVNDKLGSSLELKDLQTFRDQVEVMINQMFEEKVQISKGFDPEQVLLDIERIDKKADAISGPMHPAPIPMDAIKAVISEELAVVHDNLPKIVNDIISKMNIKGEELTTTAPLSLGHLVAMKESGYTVQEIKELKESGLI